MLRVTLGMAGVLAVVCIVAAVCIAGQPIKWSDVPKAVQKTILENGGAEGNAVDKESEVIDGKAVYEAPVKGKGDLVITEDGKLVEVKTDGESDAATERSARAKKIIAAAKFSHPREITNPYLPLSSLKQDILEGKEGGKNVRIERIAKPDVRKAFKIGDQSVESLVVEDREIEEGKVTEVTIDYFAQDDSGIVYYLGEDVDEYKDGKVVGHEGSWLLGKDTEVPGIIFPATPKVGDKFMLEDVSDTIHEQDEVVSLTEKVTAPAGTYEDCVKIKEHLADGTSEFKYYAKGVGVVREQPQDGDVLLKSHDAK